jgi:hypothetical protein
MADEATITTKLRFAKGSIDVNLEEIATTFTVAGTKYVKQTQEIGVVQEAIDLGDAGTGGYLLGINRDSTNFMTIAPDGASAECIRLEPSDVCLFRVQDASTPSGTADTAAVEFEYLLLEA